MSNDIKIKNGIKIGELDAESDEALLESCFVDNGSIQNLLELSHHDSIILGRTGSGKSALLYKISNSVSSHVVLDPNDVSIRFLEHSNIVLFFSELGVNLDLFYRVLWRHILAVELLKLRYNIGSEKESKSLVSQMSRWFHKGNQKSRAIEYFSDWGDKFWLETDEHLRGLTEKFTEDVKAKLGAKFGQVAISAEGAKGLSTEVRTEVVSLATQVVSKIQIKRLNEVLSILSEYAFQDRQKKHYILIDKLDENWAGSETRFRFIRALIEETKSFRKIPQVKIITALRRDLLDIVYDKTRESGFQEEKYEAYLSPIIWSKEDLKNIVYTRINEVYRRQYTSQNISFNDLFPNKPKYGSPLPIDYIIERTLLRPRDVIQFINLCFVQASNLPRVSWRSIYAAEAIYSSKRLKSLNEEWSEFYPSLEKTIEIIRGLTKEFTRSNINQERIERTAAELYEGNETDPCVQKAIGLYDQKTKTSRADFVSEVLRCLYHVGAIGIKISTRDTFVWSYIDQPRLTQSEVKRANQIKVHKMLRHALEIKEN